MDNIYLLTILITCYCTLAVKIDELVVPEEIQYGIQKSATLDCQFKLLADDRDTLVIKWFFENHLIYQWIPGHKPQAVGTFKDKIDLNYSVSDDPYTKYRALRIIEVTPDLTGTYTCTVFSIYNEAKSTKTMIIYKPPEKFDFELFRNNSELLCSVYDISPQPILSVYPIGIDMTNTIKNNESDKEDTNEVDADATDEVLSGFYNISRSFKYNSTAITKPTLFTCELTIPKTKFRMTRNYTLHPGNAELARASGTIMLLTLTLIFFLEYL